MLTNNLHLESGESVILTVRKHWFIILPQILFFLTGFLAPIAIYMIVSMIKSSKNVEIVLSNFPLLLFLYSLWVLGLWIMLFINWMNYYLDVWYVTEKRIIDIEQKGLFHREISNLRFEKIQDVTIEVRGIIATFLNFGDIRVQTAAENSKDFFMQNASNPEVARRVIFSRHNREKMKDSSEL